MIERARKTKSVEEKPEITVTDIKHGWTNGTVSYSGMTYIFHMKNFIEPSEFGINEGCISKLSILKIMPSGRRNEVVYYDRGWDVKPKDEDVKKVYRALLRKFNRSMPKEYEDEWWRS